MKDQRVKPFDPRTRYSSIHQFRNSNSPYTLSSCLSTKSTPSKCSSCQCSSKSSSTESEQSKHQLRMEEMRRRQRISYLLIFIIIIICLMILVFIIKNTSQLDDIINYFKHAFRKPTPLINEATRKPPYLFTGKPIVWQNYYDKD